MILQTQRTILRKLSRSDIGDMMELYNDDQIFKHEFDQPRDRSYVEAILNNILYEYTVPLSSRFEYGVEHRLSGKMIGIVSFEYKDPEELVCEIGCWLNTKYTKKGIALEIGIEVINEVFKNENTVRIFCSCSSLNLSAINLVENLGFRKEGHVKMAIYLKGAYVDELFYGLMKQDYLSNI